MSTLTVFVRTLMKTSAIFIGATAVMLHPSLNWSSSRAVTAQQSPAEGADRRPGRSAEGQRRRGQAAGRGGARAAGQRSAQSPG